MRTVKAAAVQIGPVLYSREGTVDNVVRQIRDLGQKAVGAFTSRNAPKRPIRSSNGFDSASVLSCGSSN